MFGHNTWGTQNINIFLLAKRVLQYVQVTKAHGLLLGGEVIPSSVAFSASTESEIIQLTETCKELLWLQPLQAYLGFTAIIWSTVTVLNRYTQTASHVILNNPTHSGRSKHMHVKFKLCGEVLSKREKISLKYVPAIFNCADIFTNH